MRRAAASGPPLPASLPPSGLPGLDRSWSRLVTAPDGDGVERTWHLLDSHAGRSDSATPAVTILCVHGNPTWSYLWRHVLAAAPVDVRIIAIDQLGMGYSQRLSSPRTLAQRIEDLGALTDSLGLTGPVVTLAHDWGGVISLGWALGHQAQLAGIILTNTAVYQPAGTSAPVLIRLARARALRRLCCVQTPAFVRTTTALSRPRLSRAVRDAYAAPYDRPQRRWSVADFVADIALDETDPSWPTLTESVSRLGELAAVPAFFLWGPRDPVFADRYLRDLITRFPLADVHRFEGASHLVTEDRPETATVILDWVSSLQMDTLATAPSGASATGGGPGESSLFDELDRRANDTAIALVELGKAERRTTFAQLSAAIAETVQVLRAAGVARGDRVALLIPPGLELTRVLYACWRIGAIVILADAGLGLANMGRALRGAGPKFVVGKGKGLIAARVMRLPGQLVSVAALNDNGAGAPPRTSDLRVTDSAPPRTTGFTVTDLAPIAAADEAAILFTSGATGPAKGVVYRHRQLMAQAALLRQTYQITPADRLVAAFAPFALYGPALGIASVVPEMDVTAPATLTATALAAAIASIDATLVFAAPGALRNIVATAADLKATDHAALARPRLLLSAGAPVSARLQEQLAELLPAARIHTPYGMTEALPVTDIDLADIRLLAGGQGVCVGRPVGGVTVGVSALDGEGRAPGAPALHADVVGEICIAAAHVKDRYDRLWATERASSRDSGWHRSGDVGYLDGAGRVWVQGRLRDVITTPFGPITPVPAEQRIEQLTEVAAAAVVGVGPIGAQQPVAVLVLSPSQAKTRSAGLFDRVSRSWSTEAQLHLARSLLAAQVRTIAGIDFAAVLTTAAMPFDIRHNSKIDRAELSSRATQTLTGRRHRRTLPLNRNPSTAGTTS